MDIKPCPFCGSDDLAVLELSDNSCVRCRKCYSYGPNGKDEENAIERWNSAPRKEDVKMEKCCQNCVHISKEVDGKVYCTEELDEDYSCKYWAQANPFASDPRLCWSCKYNYVDDECAMYCGREIGSPEGYVCDKWEAKASISTPLNPSNSSGLDVIGEIVTRTLFPSNIRQLIEEAAELIVACNKYLRSTGSGQPTPITTEEAIAMIEEEMADVEITGDVIKKQMAEDFSAEIKSCKSVKADRWIRRLVEEKEVDASETERED